MNGGAIKVIATGGDHHLGGVDWDTTLAEYILDAFNEANGTDYTMDSAPSELKYTLLLEAEQKKKQLTAKTSVKVNINYEGQSVRAEITRELFDALTENKLSDTIDGTRKVIEIAASKGYTNIDEFLLVGGSSKMNQIKERVDKEFGCSAKLCDPDESIRKRFYQRANRRRGRR